MTRLSYAAHILIGFFGAGLALYTLPWTLGLLVRLAPVAQP